MGWIDISGSGSNSNTNASSNSSTYGTTSPNLSNQWTTAYNNLAGNTNPDGTNAIQTPAIQAMTGMVTNNPVDPATAATNTALGTDSSNLGLLNPSYAAIAGAPTNQATAAAPVTASQTGVAQSGTAQSGLTTAGAPTTVNPNLASTYMGNYISPYLGGVVDNTLANYDQNTANQLTALNASRGASSAFGDRANLSNSQFLNQSNLNRAQTESNLLNLGFTNAIQPAEFDAGQNLSGQTFNAQLGQNNQQFNATQANTVGVANAGMANTVGIANTAQANTVGMFNANAATQTGQFNAAQANQVGMFNVTAANTQLQTSLAALNSQAANTLAQAGLSEQALGNIVTQQGIDTTAAQNLFTAGVITQAQLTAILGAAQAANGSTYSQNTSATASSDTSKVSASAGIGT